MITTSYLELNKSALKKNLSFLKELIGDGVKISSVVKGNAYGHGITEFVPLAEKFGIDHFSVFSAEEALIVKNTIKQNSEIMIMGMINSNDLEWAIEEDIQYWVFDYERLYSSLKASDKLYKPARIHIELETGFNRTGFKLSDLNKVITIIKENRKNFLIEGFCTHYAGAESIANYYRIQKQIKLFDEMCSYLEAEGITAKRKHTASSASTISYPETRKDLVRIGILQYGFWPSKETFISFLNSRKSKIDPLKRIISWKSRIMSVKKVKTGEFIGYGTSYLAQRDTLVGIVPVGYAQGFSRSLSNLGRALVKGTRVIVIGLVNMNHLMIDITDVKGVKQNDEVVLIGEQGDLSISVSSFSELSDQLNYESLTRLPENIPRVISN